jgi:4-hydroxybenzoate polyprenyltransferase
MVATRPREWLKNSFLFVALFFSKNLLHFGLLPKVVLACGLFCLAASGVYLLNDIRDRHEDQQHPQKRTRPIASGALPVALAVLAMGVLLCAAQGGALLLQPAFGCITAAYILLNVAYSYWLKHMVLLDVFSLAIGFVLRVVAGAVVIEVMISHWLLICTMFLALFLGFSKRRCELVILAQEAKHHRHVLIEYDRPFLDIMIGIVTSATVLSYTLYTVSPETMHRFHTDKLLLTVPVVLYGIFRYLYLVYRKDSGGNPAHTLLTDGPLQASVVLWGLVSAIILYTAHP